MSTRSLNPDDYQDVARPIAIMVKDFPPGFAMPAPHQHMRAQLIYATSGVVTVWTPLGTWVVPPHRAVLVPPETLHSIRTASGLAMRTLFIRREVGNLPTACCVVAVSPLLRELVVRASELPIDYDESGPDGRIFALILDEIRALPILPLHLPWPADKRLKRICEALHCDPSDTRTLNQWARHADASGRTLARLFRSETGMSFGAWRQQARLLAALGRLADGEAVTNVALDLGYQSPSAFTSMFRRALGDAPTRYFGPSA